jgi:hypothetical protein
MHFFLLTIEEARQSSGTWGEFAGSAVANADGM